MKSSHNSRVALETAAIWLPSKLGDRMLELPWKDLSEVRAHSPAPPVIQGWDGKVPFSKSSGLGLRDMHGAVPLNDGPGEAMGAELVGRVVEAEMVGARVVATEGINVGTAVDGATLDDGTLLSIGIVEGWEGSSFESGLLGIIEGSLEGIVLGASVINIVGIWVGNSLVRGLPVGAVGLVGVLGLAVGPFVGAPIAGASVVTFGLGVGVPTVGSLVELSVGMYVGLSVGDLMVMGLLVGDLAATGLSVGGRMGELVGSTGR